MMYPLPQDRAALQVYPPSEKLAVAHIAGSELL